MGLCYPQPRVKTQIDAKQNHIVEPEEGIEEGAGAELMLTAGESFMAKPT